MDNKTEISTSFLSSGALNVISQCLGGGLHALSATKLGNTITVKAASFANNSTDGKLATVRTENSFNITSDSGKLECEGTFSPGEELIPGGKSITCKSNGNENISISLNMNRGTRTVQIPRTPEVKYEPFVWELIFFGGTSTKPNYQCKSKDRLFGGVQRVQVPWELSRNDVMRGICLYTYGAGELTIDGGTPKVLKDNWGFVDYPPDGEGDQRWIDCTVNGKQIGEKKIDVRQAHVVRSSEAKTGYCANRFGLN